MSGDLETDTLLTNTGTGMITSNDYAKVIAKNEQLELEIKRLKSECDFWKENFCKLSRELPADSSHKTVEELTRELSELDLHSHTVSSQQNKGKKVLSQQFSTDGHNTSFQSDPHHSAVTLGNTNEASLKCSPHYQPASTPNSLSANASVTQKARKPIEPLTEEQSQQPEDSEAKAELVLGGGGGVHLELKPPPEGTPTEGTPTQVTPSQGNTAVVPGTTANPAAASVPPTANSQVSRKRNQRSMKGKLITDEMIMFVEGRVIRNRRDLVRKLGLTDDNIDEIEETYRSFSVKEIVHQLLMKWKKSKGVHATIGALLKALKEIERKDVFDDFCDEYGIDSNSPDEDIPDDEQSENVVPQVAKLHQQHQKSGTVMPIQDHSKHDTHYVPSIKNLHQKSEPAPLSNFDSFFSDFMVDPSTKGKKLFRKDLDKKKNFKREETKEIASEMDWDSSKLSYKFDSDVKANLKVSNVLDKWAGILLNENPHWTRIEKRDFIQEMVRSLRGEKDGREDVIAEMRKHLCAGTVGTQAKPNTQYTDLPYGMRYRLVLELNMLDSINGGGCSLVAESLGIENNLIRYLTTRPEPGHQVLRSWETQADATVGKLYDVLIHCNAMKAVAVLE